MHYDILFRTDGLHEEQQREDLRPVLGPTFELSVTGKEFR